MHLAEVSRWRRDRGTRVPQTILVCHSSGAMGTRKVGQSYSVLFQTDPLRCHQRGARSSRRRHEAPPPVSRRPGSGSSLNGCESATLASGANACVSQCKPRPEERQLPRAQSPWRAHRARESRSWLTSRCALHETGCGPPPLLLELLAISFVPCAVTITPLGDRAWWQGPREPAHR